MRDNAKLGAGLVAFAVVILLAMAALVTGGMVLDNYIP